MLGEHGGDQQTDPVSIRVEGEGQHLQEHPVALVFPHVYTETHVHTHIHITHKHIIHIHTHRCHTHNDLKSSLYVTHTQVYLCTHIC